VISLVVATINREAELDRLLYSLEEQGYRDFEIIVVDQNRDDRLVPGLQRHAGLRIQHLRCEPGLSRARNAGLRLACGDVIAFPDDDCWYPRQLLGNVAEWFESHSGFGLLSVAVRTAENQPSGPHSPPRPRLCTKSNLWGCAVSTALFLRRTVATAVGGFNEDIGVGAPSRYQSGEETDYVLRALKMGFQAWFEPALTVHHPPLDGIERLKKTSYPFGLGTGCVLGLHEYGVHQVGALLIRSLGGAAASLCLGDLARARVYVQRGAGQLVGYIWGPRELTRRAAAAGK